LQFRFNIHHFERAVRDDSGGYRVYTTPKGQVYPSITTVLSKTKTESDKKHLQDWIDNTPHSEYISSEARDIGTQTHQLIEDYLHNRPSSIKVDLLSIAHFERIKVFLHKITEVHGTEEMLYSDKLKLAGTADCIGMYDGNLSIIDYKTKRSDQRESYLTDYFLQSTAYSIMWEEMTGDPIHQIVILVSSRKGQLKEFIVNPDDYKDELLCRVKSYYEMDNCKS